MEYRVNSLQEAIGYTLEQLKYDQNNSSIIKKLILNALEGKSEYFTEEKYSKEYIQNKSKDELFKEIKDNSIVSDNVDQIIDNYIMKNFEKNVEIILDKINNNSDLDKVEKKIRYININSDNDRNFYNNVWSYFSKIFVGSDSTNISSNELKNDMLQAALKVANETRDKARVLKQLSLNSEDINVVDSVILVDEYIHKGKINELLYFINTNKNLSGALLQNLLDYTYFSKNHELNISSVIKLDSVLSNVNSVQAKAELLYELMTEKKHEDFGISREDVIVDLLKNSLSLYGYSKYMDNPKDTDMYAINNSALANLKKQTNNRLVEELIINGENTTVDDIVNIYNSYNDQTLHFLADTYVISRSTKDNQYRLNDLKYYTNTSIIHLFNLLDSDELKELLKMQNTKKAA